VGLGFLAFWDSGFGGFVIPLTARFAVGGERMSQSSERSVSPISGEDHQSSSPHLEIDWDFLAARFSSVCRLGPRQPPLSTRLVAVLFILKHMHLSDEALCERGRTRIFSISAARWCSGTSRRSIARR
jgi:IS5 family transposase